MEGSSSAHHHLHHSPESWGGGGGPASSSSSSSPLPPSALRRHRPMMVDSTGIGPGPSSGPPGQTSSSTAGDDTTASGVAGGTMSEGSASESSPRQCGVQSLVTSREEDGEEDGQGGEAEDAVRNWKQEGQYRLVRQEPWTEVLFGLPQRLLSLKLLNSKHSPPPNFIFNC